MFEIIIWIGNEKHFIAQVPNLLMKWIINIGEDNWIKIRSHISVIALD